MKNFSLNTRIIIVISSLLLLVLFAALLFFSQSLWFASEQNDINYRNQMIQESELADSFLHAGNPMAAVETFDRMIITSADDSTRYNATIRKASALFATGDIEKSYEAVDILGSVLEDPTATPLFKGWALAELLRSFYMSQHSGLLAHMRSLSALADLSGLSDVEFLKHAAKRSDDLYPTVLGKLFLAIPIARELEYTETEDIAILSDMSEEIVSLAQASESLQLKESWFNDPYSEMLAAHYRGIVLSTAVKGGADTLLAQEQFELALQISEQNTDVLSVQNLSVYTHIYYVAHLLRSNASGVSGRTVDEQLSAVIFDAPSVPTFSYYVQAAYNNPTSSNYKLLSTISSASPSFKTFLEDKYSVIFD